MNERIQELAKQASTFAFTEYPKQTMATFNTNKSVDQLFNQKFAQLIVRECVEQGKLSQSQTVVNGSEEYNSGREMGIEVFMNQIKKHFGVEP